MPPSTQVLNGTENTWRQIVLSNAFHYNGTNNLLIELCWTKISGGLITSTATGAPYALLGATSTTNRGGVGLPRCVLRLHYQAGQTIAFPPIPNQLTTNMVPLAATASSGLPVSFQVGAGPGQISGGSNLSFTAAGTVSVTASQAGHPVDWLAAPSVTRTADVTKARQAPLLFSPPATQLFSQVVGLTASGGSGSGSVSYAVQAGPGSIAGGTNLLLTAGAGTVVVVAAKAADAMFQATAATGQVAAAKGAQAIAFPNPGDQVGTNTVQLSATASSGLPVVFAVESGPATLVDLTNLIFSSAGSVSIVASQEGSDNWNPAPAITQTFAVGKSAQAPLFIEAASPLPFATTNAVTVTGGSGDGAVSLAVIAGPGRIADGTTLVVTAGSGAIEIEAVKAGDPIYVSQSACCTVTAVKADQQIAWVAIPDQLASNRLTLAAAASSELPVTYAVASGPATLVDTNVLGFYGTGVVTVAAHQAGDGNWNGAAPVAQSFSVSKATAEVLMADLGQVYDGTPRKVSVASFPPVQAIVVTYGGNASAPVNAGRYTVVARVVDACYKGSAAGTLAVAKAIQIIRFPPVPDQLVTGQVRLAATASSGLPVSLAVVSGPGVLTDRTLLRFTRPGTVVVSANQAGNLNWEAAPTEFGAVKVLPVLAGIHNADFDGDRLADPGIYNMLTATWIVRLSSAGYGTFTFPGLLGGPGWTAAAADYDGDGRADPAVYQEASGSWNVLPSGSGYALLNRAGFLGSPGWAAIGADFDGDGAADCGVYQETTGTWTLKLSSARYAPLTLTGLLGGPGRTVMAGDFDGDGRADPAVYARADSTSTVLLSGSAYTPVTLPRFLGGPGWTPVPADYDGDGRADPAIRAADGSVWRVLLSGSGYVLLSVPLGL